MRKGTEKFHLTQPCLIQCLVCQSAFHEIWRIDDSHNGWMGRPCTACLAKAWHCLCVAPYHGIACITVPIHIIIIINRLSWDPIYQGNRLSWKSAVSGHAWLVQRRLAFFGIPPSSASSPLCMHHSNSSLGMSYLFLLLTRVSLDLAKPKACRQSYKIGIQYHTHIYTPCCICITAIHHLPRSKHGNCSTCTIWGMQQAVMLLVTGHIWWLSI